MNTELTPAQTTIVANLSKDERKTYDGLRKESDKLSFLVTIELAGSLVPTDLDFESADQVEDQTPIIRFATEKHPEGLKAGSTIVGKLLGYMPIFSPEAKENWTQKMFDGKVFYENGFFKFQKIDGSGTFGVYASASLWRLKKIATKATNPLRYENPIVKIEYVGLVEGKDVLKDKYGIEITTGNSAHVCNILVGSGQKTENLMIKGIVNYLREPKPILASTDARADDAIANDNYAAQVAANVEFEKANVAQLN